jgi:hypothetical protein
MNTFPVDFPNSGTSPVTEHSVPSPTLTVSFDPAINYAFQQNAIPVVRELRFQNDDVARKDLVIRVTTEPAFATPVDIRLQGITAKRNRHSFGIAA